MPKKIDPALRERAVRLVLEHRAEYPSTSQAIAAVARQEGIGAESLRRWVAQGSAEGLVDLRVYAASVAAGFMMSSNSMGVSFPSRR